MAQYLAHSRYSVNLLSINIQTVPYKVQNKRKLEDPEPPLLVSFTSVPLVWGGEEAAN